MRWDYIQREAKQRGFLVYAIDQGQTVPMVQPGPWGPIEHGYCAGLAANWIALAYQGKDFLYSGQECNDPPWQSTMAQTNDLNAVYINWINEWKLLAAQFQCTVGHHVAHLQSPTSEFICNAASRPTVAMAFRCGGTQKRTVHRADTT